MSQTLKGASPVFIEGQTVEDFIKNSVQNLQRNVTVLPGDNQSGTSFLHFDGNTGDWKLNREPVDPASLGRIIIPPDAIFEGMVEWANQKPLQKTHRPLLGVELPRPLSPVAYGADPETAAMSTIPRAMSASRWIIPATSGTRAAGAHDVRHN